MNAYRFLLKATLAVAAIGLLDASPVFAAKKQKQKVTDPRLQTVLTMTKPVKEEQFVVKGVKLFTTSRAIQGFDVADNEATLWYSQPGKIAGMKQGSTKQHEVYVIRGRGRSGERMLLRYFNNGNNIAVEHAEQLEVIRLVVDQIRDCFRSFGVDECEERGDFFIRKRVTAVFPAAAGFLKSCPGESVRILFTRRP